MPFNHSWSIQFGSHFYYVFHEAVDQQMNRILSHGLYGIQNLVIVVLNVIV